MIQIKNAQSVISNLQSKYEKVQEHTSNALVCISTNFVICVKHDLNENNNTNILFLFESINELTCMGKIVISEEIYRNFFHPTFLIN